MALVKCKECGNDVARDAKTCPKCGTKLMMGLGKKLGFGFLGAFVFMLFVGMVGSKDAESGVSANVTPEPKAVLLPVSGKRHQLSRSATRWTSVIPVGLCCRQRTSVTH